MTTYSQHLRSVDGWDHSACRTLQRSRARRATCTLPRARTLGDILPDGQELLHVVLRHRPLLTTLELLKVLDDDGSEQLQEDGAHAHQEGAEERRRPHPACGPRITEPSAGLETTTATSTNKRASRPGGVPEPNPRPRRVFEHRAAARAPASRGRVTTRPGAPHGRRQRGRRRGASAHRIPRSPAGRSSGPCCTPPSAPPTPPWWPRAAA